VLVAIVLLIRRPPTIRAPLRAGMALLGLMWAFELHRFGLV
jgi:hypothetical protein